MKDIIQRVTLTAALWGTVALVMVTEYNFQVASALPVPVVIELTIGLFLLFSASALTYGLYHEWTLRKSVVR